MSARDSGTGANEAAARSNGGTVTVRALVAADFEAVVALDGRVMGETRRGYFEKRLAAAFAEPKRHLQLAAATPAGLVGFALSRIAGGEFGRPGPCVVLESMGVDVGSQHAGIGRRMLARLDELARARDVRMLVTQADWRRHAILRFLDGAGFSLAPRQILERSLARPAESREDGETPRVLCRALTRADFDSVVRIDAAITGKARPDYFRRKFDEELNESAIEVSLVAESDGFVVAFAMARVDFGDFGRVGAVAALDTIGVSPAFAGRGYGAAVLAQLLDNLAALRVERVETEIARTAFELLRFLYRAGFGPSARLAFQREL